MYDKWVGIPWLKGGYTLEACDCYGLVILAIKDLFGIEITSLKGSMAEGNDLHNVITKETKKYIQVNKPVPSSIVIMYEGNIAAHIGLMIDYKNVLHSIKTSSSINSLRVLEKVYKKVEFYNAKNLNN